MTSLDGFEIDGHGWNGSGPFTSPVDLLTLHTTEGDGIEGARSTLNGKGAQPHALVEARAAVGRRRIQMVDLDRAAKALRNQPGGIQTNRNGTLQIELVGFAAHPERLTEDDWLWFGREVVGPMCRAKGIPLVAPLRFHPYPPPGQQLGREPWRLAPGDLKGIVGHQHWQENAHGDPGDLSTPIYRNGTASPMDLILGGAGATAPHPPTTVPPTVEPGGFPMALTDAEQQELLDIARRIDAELLTPGKGLRATIARTARRTADLVSGKRPLKKG